VEEIVKKISQLQTQYDNAFKKLNIEQSVKEIEKLDEQIAASDFWSDNRAAQETMKKQASLKALVDPWIQLGKEISDVSDMLALNDSALADDLKVQTTKLEESFNSLKSNLRFSGKYDNHNAVVTLSAGAGGTDAQDWTSMLLRMYLRWAEKDNYAVTLIEEAAGEEAGLKRATFEVVGPFAYGKLTSEAGVHRLVRLSPFNSDSLRQTSFAKVEVMPEIDTPSDLEIDPKELKVDVYRAGGHGGQSVNTTDSAVRVTHVPTGVTVSIQNERSQLQNKETAMTILRSRLAMLQLEQHKERLSELKGPNTSAEWGNQIRSYVLHPYKQVKDLRSKYETSDVDSVLDGNLNPLIDAYLETTFGE
jgi:peptide chain release factor 2